MVGTAVDGGAVFHPTTHKDGDDNDLRRHCCTCQKQHSNYRRVHEFPGQKGRKHL